MKKLVKGILFVSLLLAGFIYYFYHSFTAVSTGKPIAQYDRPAKALMVIDVQRGITDRESSYGLDPGQRKKMFLNINRMLKSEKLLEIEVIYIRQVFADDFWVKFFTGGMMQRGSKGAQISPEIQVVSKNIFTKQISDAFSNPELDSFLIDHKINHLYITGLDAEACVDKTLKAALNRKYTVTVIKDAIATKSDKGLDDKIADFSDLGAEIISASDFLN